MSDERKTKFKSGNSFKKRVISLLLTGVMVLGMVLLHLSVRKLLHPIELLWRKKSRRTALRRLR